MAREKTGAIVLGKLSSLLNTQGTTPHSWIWRLWAAGFTGLAAAAWLKTLAPEKTVALFEADTIGAGSSGHTGGVALAESAVGDLPGLGDVLAGYQSILQTLKVNADSTLPGAYELGRSNPLPEFADSLERFRRSLRRQRSARRQHQSGQSCQRAGTRSRTRRSFACSSMRSEEVKFSEQNYDCARRQA